MRIMLYNKTKTLLYAVITFPLLFIFFSSCKKVQDAQPLFSDGNISSLRASKRPNIILILGDDVGFEVPQYFGGQSYTTPRINQMAAQGIQFNQCYSSPLCSPSRFMMLTGKYNFRNYGLWGIMDTTNRTIANMLRDAGYKTMVAGKWQLDGGDASIHALGFNDYMVYDPYEDSGIAKGSRYKDPTLYQYGKIVNKDSMKGKYGEDVLVNYIENWIDSNKGGKQPFFIYYPVCLCHYPYCPTPEYPEFATWDNATSNPDPKFFPSMVNYMDTKIGEVLDKIQSAGILKNTIVLYVCDNGT
ncbi:MAG TPA: sulfatase-like hydrolase/transferase, partial [Parafilimonas sp.]